MADNGAAIFVCALLSMISSVLAQNQCISKTTCSECIRVPSCTWCSPTSPGSSVDDDASSFPCNSRANNVHCDRSRLIDPQAKYAPIRSEPVTRGVVRKKLIQLSPQEVQITSLRIGQVYNITLQYTQAKDYPIDLYFLMDLSNSMGDDKKNVEDLGKKMAETMQSVTSNFSLGFGSFVDKRIAPFAFAPNDRADYAYSFVNHLPLGRDSRGFVNTVKSVEISITRDSPEGGMDALLQAVVCPEIGWRNPSRRLLVFATDARSHLAGNGRIAGIIAPNDGQCHLKDKRYSKALQQDYPSLGQIAKLVRDHSVNIIFAVTSDAVTQYKVMSKKIRGSTVAILAKDSSNIVSLIKEQYESISSSVEMTSMAPDGINVRFYTPCMGQKLRENRLCTGLKVGDSVTFTASIEVLRCPATRGGRASFSIRPVGLNEELVVHLGVVCDCPCEIQGFERNSAQCHEGGDLKCGVCHCDGFHSGKNCECTSGQDQMELQSRCLGADNSTCSNRGQCVCGQCVCNRRSNPMEVISGAICQCDNFSCPRRGGLICSGNGRCQCGKCNCFEGWSDSDCSCRSDEFCKAFGDDLICAGNGQCECGTCKCVTGSGRFCQRIDKELCGEYHFCIMCTLNKTDEQDREQCGKLCNFPATFAESLQDALCLMTFDENGESCQVPFNYGFNEQNGQKWVQYGRTECFPVPVLAISLGLTGFIVAAGVGLLLAWRIITYLYDKKEYAKFMNETKNAKWTADNNPLYVEASSTFQNPVFNQQ